MPNENYYEHVRPELIEQIPTTAKRILDVGCGSGQTGAHLKNRDKTIEVVGIEYVESVGAIAKENLDQAFVGNVEELTLPFPDEYFDCILYGDLLEHLVDPWKVLSSHAKLLAKDGCIIASIPNIAYFKVIKMLKNGHWKYEDAGIMDKTHLRFFTYSSIVELFEKAGLEAVVVNKTLGGAKPIRTLSQFLPKRWANRYVQQYIIRATKKK
ncbi:MAG: class I SAM-dependent methyltransferase [Phycisphaerales bacterium]|jgi:ubiquinone/menaquinone biosynthesis C-methylase UbiE|nr:class I SAM-dependent methyltransferase [Phycisphaerales bacterium]MDP6693566.1 class I SAM-dependent methyltransferase [Phycisphaerales bacterium]